MQVSLAQWNEFISAHPTAHILQTGAWGELKSAFGWRTSWIVTGDCGVLVLFRPLPGGLSIGYVPKGPVGMDSALIDELDQVCRENRAIFVKVEPDSWEPETPSALFKSEQWKISRPIQPRRTVVLSLEGTEEDILARMKQKTRYNIRLAEKKEVIVRQSEDVRAFSRMVEVTSVRDKFGVHNLAYYQKAYELFHPAGNCELLIAFYQDTPIAGLMVFAQGDMAWYMYGASTDLERNRMPAYLIQWEAIKLAKAQGCKYYDLWGIPDMDENKLEESFTVHHSHDGLWGVYRFKRGFGGEIWRSIGAWDRVYKPGLYHLYQWMTKLWGGSDD